MAQPTHAGSKADAPSEHVEHITSWAPLIIALGVPFLYLAMLYPAVGLAIGVPVMAIGLGWWIREDVKRFAKVVKRPKEKGVPGPLWGTWLFIGTEILIFGGIFAVWFVGKYGGEAVWGVHDNYDPIHLPLVETAINTAILVASGGTLHWGYLGLKRNNHRRFITGLVLTILLGTVFLAGQVREYLHLMEQGITLQGVGEPGGIPNDIFGSAFYMLTGTHGLHVAGGLFVLLIVLYRALKKTQTKDHHVITEAAAIYWHFVDVVWLLLFAVVYLNWV
jgi:cytochrome c oxidase subunit III